MGWPLNILVIEDDSSLRTTVTYNLKREGYTVRAAEDGPNGLTLALDGQSDLVVLDLMLPGMDGFELCRQLRRQSNVPILILSARSDEVDRVVGLEIGADDYLTKPFSMRELVARVRAMLRRAQLTRLTPEAGVIRLGELQIDP